MVEWPNFRNFIGDNQIVMNKNKPLDQVRSTGANALNLTSKLVNKSEFNGSILERLMDFARLFHLKMSCFPEKPVIL